MTERTGIHPVLLSGGAGKRLWPLSRRDYPKQLLPLTGPESLFQDTLRRVGAGFEAPLIICNQEHRFLIAEQARALEITPSGIVLEPVGRDTAPAAAAAALLVAERDPDALLLLLPADHVVRDVPAFHAALTLGAAAAHTGHLVIFGIAPEHPETGYGYIRRGGPLDGLPGCERVARFAEKPDQATAAAFLASGAYLWNGGIFLFKARTLLEELARQTPALLDAVREAVAARADDLDFARLGAEAFAKAPTISLDCAVIEGARSVAVVPVSMGWSDVGSWTALRAVGVHDTNGNVLSGDVVAEESRDCYLRSDGPLLAALGLRDIVAVATADAVLVASHDRAQDIKPVVDRLSREGRPEAVEHPRVYRPWGFYQTIDSGERFKVKRLMVRPGHKLSLQMHHHRAEHWVVVRGVARVAHGDAKALIQENESIYIPIGTKHRLENPGLMELHLIEVQSGSYLEEDDIVRYQDIYNRA